MGMYDDDNRVWMDTVRDGGASANTVLVAQNQVITGQPWCLPLSSVAPPWNGPFYTHPGNPAYNNVGTPLIVDITEVPLDCRVFFDDSDYGYIVIHHVGDVMALPHWPTGAPIVSVPKSYGTTWLRTINEAGVLQLNVEVDYIPFNQHGHYEPAVYVLWVWSYIPDGNGVNWAKCAHWVGCKLDNTDANPLGTYRMACQPLSDTNRQTHPGTSQSYPVGTCSPNQLVVSM